MKTPSSASLVILAGVLITMILPALGRSVSKNAWPPAFCNKLDCPKYSIIDDTHKDWEERLYAESHWVGTSMSGVDFDSANEKMFMKLFAYIQGSNEKGVEIEMAVPVIVKATVDHEKAKVDDFYRNFTMSFYLPYAYQNATAPKPTIDGVFLWTMPESKAFVKSFDGYANEGKDVFNAGSLAAELGDERAYDHGYMYAAGYNSPWQILFRHNEVWFVALN